MANFPYIIPFDNTQDCDIYGPSCQTGSITVGVNLTTATTTTVLPCSSYLSAQAAYLIYENDPPSQSFFDPPWEGQVDEMVEGSDLEKWNVKFGQSPQCRSYVETLSQGGYILSGCGTTNAIIQTAGDPDFGSSPDSNYSSQLPPGIVRFFSPDYVGTCCGNCSLDIPEVRLYYFPDQTTECHYNQTANASSTLLARNLEKRIHSLVANGSTAVVGAHTLSVKYTYLKEYIRINTCYSTSPSIYLQLMGTATVQDQCTTVGPKLINPIITLAPGELSTWVPVDDGPFTVGQIWDDPSQVPDPNAALAPRAGIAPLKVKDLACPTWGLGTSIATNGTAYTTIGPPWLPLIVPPTNIFSLDPIWAATCTGMFSDSYAQTTFVLFDPPIALTPAALLLPSPPARLTPAPTPTPADPTTGPEPATRSTEAARPASLPNDPAAVPAKTGDPGRSSPTYSPAVASADPAVSASLPDGVANSPDNKDDPAPDSPSDLPSDPKVPSNAGDPSGASDPPPNDPPNSPTDPKTPVVIVPQGGDPPTQTQGLGAIIYNAFGNSGPKNGGSSPSPIASPPESIFTIDAQTFTADPKGFNINNAAIVPGGTAQTVDGTRISLDQSGVLAIGSSTISLPSPSDIAPSKVYTIAGQTFTPNPSGFSIVGTVISPGGPAATIDGTAISLDQSGVLAIGSTTISLTAPTPTPFAAKAFTIGDQIFTPNPSAFSIAGTTVSAGGPAATISGTVISLGQSGVLAIGSSSINLPTPSYTPGEAYTIAGQPFTPNPTAFTLAGTTISAGGPPATLNGTTISLDPSGTLLLGSSTIPLLLPSPTAFAAATTIDGFAIQAEPSFAVVDGITVSAAASGVVVSGQTVSLESGGKRLDVGTGSFALPTGGNGVGGVQAFEGGQGKRGGVSGWVLGCGGFAVLGVVGFL